MHREFLRLVKSREPCLSDLQVAQKSLFLQRDIILSLFKDVIVFFNVDAEPPESEKRWDSYIEDLIRKSKGIPLFGVIYSKRQTSADKAMIEKRYLYDMGLRCGCIQLEYKKNENFDLISRSLYANQAQGRRKTIRALCTSACTYKFLYLHGASSQILMQGILKHLLVGKNGGLQRFQLLDSPL